MTSFTVSLISGQNRLLPSQNQSEALLLNSFFMHERGGLSLPILYWLKEWQWSSEREKTRRGGDNIKEIKLERNTSGWQTFQLFRLYQVSYRSVIWQCQTFVRDVHSLPMTNVGFLRSSLVPSRFWSSLNSISAVFKTPLGPNQTARA